MTTKADLILARKQEIIERQRRQYIKNLSKWNIYKEEKIDKVSRFVAILKKKKRLKILISVMSLVKFLVHL